MRKIDRTHHTSGLDRHAASEDFGFEVGQRVMTVDGYPGVVTDVLDAPIGVSYVVLLDDGMGGGEYNPSDLSDINDQRVASKQARRYSDVPLVCDCCGATATESTSGGRGGHTMRCPDCSKQGKVGHLVEARTQYTYLDADVILSYDDDYQSEGQAQERFVQNVSGPGLHHFVVNRGMVDEDGVPIQERSQQRRRSSRDDADEAKIARAGVSREGSGRRTAARPDLPLLDPSEAEAKGLHVASTDYPEFEDILWQRPDHVGALPSGVMSVSLGSRTAASRDEPDAIGKSLSDPDQPWWWRKVVGPSVKRVNDKLPDEYRMKGEVSGYVRNWCFAGETEFLTYDGYRTFKEAVGTTQKVLDGNGNWVDAPVRAFGQQRLYRLTLKKRRGKKVIYTTADHRWLVQNGNHNGMPRDRVQRVTRDLAPGDALAFQIIRRPKQRPSSFGIAHGIVFGDGTLGQSGERASAWINLWGEKDAQLAKWFPAHDITSARGHRANQDVDGVRVGGLPRFFKSLPSLDETNDYLYGWLVGYFAADGRVGANGGNIELTSASRENLGFVQAVCNRLGIMTYSISSVSRFSCAGRGRIHDYRVEKYGYCSWDTKPSDVHTLRFVAESLPPEFFLIGSHRGRFEQRRARDASRKGALREALTWRVESVEETDRVEEVYCVSVPTTESFVLQDGILTGNCRFRTANEHCMFPEVLDDEATRQAGYAVWVPKDRGRCRRSAWDDQIACPIGEPGPDSGERIYGPDATRTWWEGGQRYTVRRGSVETPVEIRRDGGVVAARGGTTAGKTASDTRLMWRSVEGMGSDDPSTAEQAISEDMDEWGGLGTWWGTQSEAAFYAGEGALLIAAEGPADEFEAAKYETGWRLRPGTPLTVREVYYVGRGADLRKLPQSGPIRAVAKTLYRGEGDHDRPSYYPATGPDALTGAWWTDDQAKARNYAAGGSVYSIEVEDGEYEARGGAGNYVIIDPAVRERRVKMAAWRDVREKAVRIRRDGGVRIIANTGTTVTAEVRGDNDIYLSSITRVPGTKQRAISICSCKWEQYRWARSAPWKRYEGRHCAHLEALSYEIQAHEMFGGTIIEQTEAPVWRTHEPRQDRREGQEPEIYPVQVLDIEAALANVENGSFDKDDALLALGNLSDGLLVAQESMSPNLLPTIVSMHEGLLEASNRMSRVAFKAQIGGQVREVVGLWPDGDAEVDGMGKVPARQVKYPTWDPTLGLTASKEAVMLGTGDLGHTAAKTAALKVYRGITLKGSHPNDFGLESSVMNRYAKLMKAGDHSGAAQFVLDIAERSGFAVEGGGTGLWYTTDLGTARGYGGPHSRYPGNAEGTLGMVIHGEVDEADITDDHYGYSSESPVTVRPGAKVKVTAVDLRWNENPRALISDGEWVHVPISRTITAAKTAAIEWPSQIPAEHRSLLESFGVKIEVVPNGAGNAAQYDYARRTIMLKEGVGDPALIHEIGHALDHARGEISATAQWRAIWKSYFPSFRVQGMGRTHAQQEAELWASLYQHAVGDPARPIMQDPIPDDVLAIVRGTQTAASLGLSPKTRWGSKQVLAAGSGVMVALSPSRDVCERLSALAAEAGYNAETPEQIHLTLAYCGKADQVDKDALLTAVRGFAAQASFFTGKINGLGTFYNEGNGDEAGVLWAAADIPGLAAARTALIEALKVQGIEVATNHDFTPHITLAYQADPITALPDASSVSGTELLFTTIVAAHGGEWTHIDLVGSSGETTAVETIDVTAHRKEANAWYHAVETAYRNEVGVGSSNLDALTAMLRRILKAEGVPQADDAYAQPYIGKTVSSAIGFDFDTSPPIGFVVLGSDMIDTLTLVHEAAHLVERHRTGRWGRKASGPDDAHNSAWASIFLELAGKWLGPSLVSYLRDGWRAMGFSGTSNTAKAISGGAVTTESVRSGTYPEWNPKTAVASTMYHLTSKVDFALDPRKRPSNNTTLGGDWEPSIFLTTQVEHWVNGYGYWQPWVVEFDTSSLTSDDIIFEQSDETLVRASAYPKLRIRRVIPLDGYCRERYNDWGWTEGEFETDYLTGAPLEMERGYPKGKPPSTPAPDARSMPGDWQQAYKKRVADFRRKRGRGAYASLDKAAAQWVGAGWSQVEEGVWVWNDDPSKSMENNSPISTAILVDTATVSPSSATGNKAKSLFPSGRRYVWQQMPSGWFSAGLKPMTVEVQSGGSDSFEQAKADAVTPSAKLRREWEKHLANVAEYQAKMKGLTGAKVAVDMDVIEEIHETEDEHEFAYAGVIIKALDSGRVLMTQRTPYHNDDDGAYGRWEFPGGHIEDDEDSIMAALREFQEETGLTLPDGWEVAGHCPNPQTDYMAIVVTVPNEAWTTDATLLTGETMGIGWFELDNLDGIARDECVDTDFEIVREAAVSDSNEIIDRGRATADGRCIMGGKHSWGTSIVDASGEKAEKHNYCSKCQMRVRPRREARQVTAAPKPLRVGPGVYWRFHPNGRKWEVGGGSSKIEWATDDMPGGIATKSPGYSCFANPWHLYLYIREMDWDTSKGKVVGFTGKIAGSGWDGEPTVIPDSQPFEKMSWDDFEYSVEMTNSPATPWYEGINMPIEVTANVIDFLHENPRWMLDTTMERHAESSSFDASFDTIPEIEPENFDMEAILHDEPEPALPEVLGADDDFAGIQPGEDPYGDEDGWHDEDGLHVGSTTSALDPNRPFVPGDPRLSHLSDDPGAGPDDNSDIAAVAAAFLKGPEFFKEALKTFSPAEQAEIINEGADGHLGASNTDVLQIEGTHYAYTDDDIFL